jgi:hypothetical protein
MCFIFLSFFLFINFSITNLPQNLTTPGMIALQLVVSMSLTDWGTVLFGRWEIEVVGAFEVETGVLETRKPEPPGNKKGSMRNSGK